MQQKICCLCGLKDARTWPIGLFDGYRFDCERCGMYIVSDELVTFSKDYLSGFDYILSALARELNEISGHPPKFSSENFKEKLKDPLIPDLRSVEAKSKKLLVRFKEKSSFY